MGSADGETGSEAGRGDEIGKYPIFDATGLHGPQDYTVSLRVHDPEGQEDPCVVETTIHIINDAPVVDAGDDMTTHPR